MFCYDVNTSWVLALDVKYNFENIFWIVIHLAMELGYLK